MNVLSLFDGMSCGQIALERAGISVDKYYASEVDKYAITVTQANYPETVQLGDVTKWREWSIDWASIDLLIGGSPCQGFSSAGNQLAFDDPRSKLFFVYVNILNLIKSANHRVKFLLENVRMKKEYLGIISEHLAVDPIGINSSLVSAQNRFRYYWCNWSFMAPDDKGVLLKHILERDNDSLIMQKPRGNNVGGLRAIHGKTPCLSSNSWEHNNHLIFSAARRGRGDEVRTDHKTNALLSGGHQSRWLAQNNILYRKLTPIECERLQTVADNYTNHASNTQRYKMLGNGWTVDVIAHIFNNLQNTAD